MRTEGGNGGKDFNLLESDVVDSTKIKEKGWSKGNQS